MLLEVSIMEGIYIIYMFVFFKTCYTVEFNKLGSNMITELLSKELNIDRINSYVIIIIFIFCFMNYNALIYMLPIFMLELYMTNIGLVGKNITNN